MLRVEAGAGSLESGVLLSIPWGPFISPFPGTLAPKGSFIVLDTHSLQPQGLNPVLPAPGVCFMGDCQIHAALTASVPDPLQA